MNVGDWVTERRYPDGPHGQVLVVDSHNGLARVRWYRGTGLVEAAVSVANLVSVEPSEWEGDGEQKAGLRELMARATTAALLRRQLSEAETQLDFGRGTLASLGVPGWVIASAEQLGRTLA